MRADLCQFRLVQRPARDRERFEHVSCRACDRGRPGQEQRGEPGGQRCVALPGRPDQLLSEERIPLGTAECRLDEALRRAFAEQQLDLLGGLREGQRQQVEAVDPAVALHPVDPVRRWCLLDPARDDSRDAGRVPRHEQVVEQFDGGRVGPMHVLDHDRNAAKLRRSANEVAQRVQQLPAPPPVVGHARVRRRCHLEPRQQPADFVGDEAGTFGQRALQELAAVDVGQSAQHVDHRQVRQPARQRQTPTGQHSHAGACGVRHSGGHQS